MRVATFIACLLCLALPSAAWSQRVAQFPDPPQVLFKDLFGAVQGAQVFADGKVFPDAVPNAAPQDILRSMMTPTPEPIPTALPLTEAAGAPRRTFGVKEQHRNSWGWKVSAYLWTKSLAAGAFLVPALRALADPSSTLGAVSSPEDPSARR